MGREIRAVLVIEIRIHHDRLHSPDLFEDRHDRPHLDQVTTLRHYLATHRLEAGTDPPPIQALMGHRWIGTTMMYVCISRRHLASLRSPSTSSR